MKNVLNVNTVYATCGSDVKKRYLEDNLKVSKVFNYKTPAEENFHEQIAELTENKGVDVVFDCVGGSYWEKNLESLGVDGELILYGLMGGGSVNGNILAKILKKRINLKSTTLRARSIDVNKTNLKNYIGNIKLSLIFYILVQTQFDQRFRREGLETF